MALHQYHLPKQANASTKVSNESHAHISGSLAESGYGSYTSLHHPHLHCTHSSVDHSNSSLAAAAAATTTSPTGQKSCLSANKSSDNNEPPTPTTSAINNLLAFHLTTPQQGGDQMTPRKWSGSRSYAGHSTSATKKMRGVPVFNDENSQGTIGGGKFMVMSPKEVRFSQSLRRPSLLRQLSADNNSSDGYAPTGQLDCTFEALSSSTPIKNPFRAEFYVQRIEEVASPAVYKHLPRSTTKSMRTKIIRKMQSFSPKKLSAMQKAKQFMPLKELDLNKSRSDSYADVIMEMDEEGLDEPSPVRCCSVKKILSFEAPAFHNLLHADIKVPAANTDHMPSPSRLLDIYADNLSALDSSSVPMADAPPWRFSNECPPNQGHLVDADGKVERYFNELKKNATSESVELQECPLVEEDEGARAVIHTPATASLDKNGCVAGTRKRRKGQLFQDDDAAAAHVNLSTPKKLKRAASFQCDGEGRPYADGGRDENAADRLAWASPSCNRVKRARKRLYYEPLGSFNVSPAKRHLIYEEDRRMLKRQRHSEQLLQRRPSLQGTTRINIFKHLAHWPPVLEYFFTFLDGRDLATVHVLSRHCRQLIDSNQRWTETRMAFVRQHMRKKENVTGTGADLSGGSVHAEPTISRRPLHSLNVAVTSGRESMVHSPPVSPPRRKFYENQKVIQRNPGAVLVPCPWCRSSSVVMECDSVGDVGRRMSQPGVSIVGIQKSALRKQISEPAVLRSGNGRGTGQGEQLKVAVCQSLKCGYQFCVHCGTRYTGREHKCMELGTLSPRIAKMRSDRVVACTKQSKRNLKRLL